MNRKRYADRRAAWPPGDAPATMSGDGPLQVKLEAEGRVPRWSGKRHKKRGPGRRRISDHEAELWEDWKDADGYVVRFKP